MRAFIQHIFGEPWNEECRVVLDGFTALGIECIPFSNVDELDYARREDVVVGGMFVCEHALARLGKVPPAINYPESLRFALGRNVWESTVGELSTDMLPLFVKPAKEKDLPGIVVASERDLEPYFAKPRDYKVLCSEPVAFRSEWRCFIRHGKLIGIRHYNGQADCEPDQSTLKRIIRACANDPYLPAGFSVDLGVTDDGRTLLIEANDGYALDCYGLCAKEYALLLSARWAELVVVKDPLADVACESLCMLESEAKLSQEATLLLKELGYEHPRKDMSDDYLFAMEDAVADIAIYEANNLEDGSPDFNENRLNAAEEILDCIGLGKY